jgi:hypothetical protein
MKLCSQSCFVGFGEKLVVLLGINKSRYDIKFDGFIFTFLGIPLMRNASPAEWQKISMHIVTNYGNG